MPLLEEEGRFPAKVTAAELGEAQTGTPFVQLNFETDEGSTSVRVWLSDKAFDRSLEVLKECFAFDGNFENLNPIVGQECSITTEFEEYENDAGETKKSLRVKWINPKGGPKLDPSKRQSLAARLSAKAGVKPSAPVEVDNGDEPF
jgi:hypothetical protein